MKNFKRQTVVFGVLCCLFSSPLQAFSGSAVKTNRSGDLIPKWSLGLSYGLVVFTDTEEKTAPIFMISVVRKLNSRVKLFGSTGFLNTNLAFRHPKDAAFAPWSPPRPFIESIRLIPMRLGIAYQWQSKIGIQPQFYFHSGLELAHVRSILGFSPFLEESPDSVVQKGWLIGPWLGIGFSIPIGSAFYLNLGMDYQNVLRASARENHVSLGRVNFTLGVYRSL